jgi:hypothetical protein
VTVVSRSLSHADRTPRLHAPGSGPLRPELEAPLGVCPPSQLTQGVGGSTCSLLSGGVAVLCCCIGSPCVSLLDAATCAVWSRRPSVFQAGRPACPED